MQKEMEDFPAAIYLASEESVFHNPAVLFDLVRPTKTGNGVESAAGLANVIPRKRIYRMETEEELEIFKNELLRRPLVLQPTTHSGKGIGKGTKGCALWVNHINWILLINQTHPKILGRIQMGVDAAKQAMANKEPFLLRYKFGSLLQRLHFLIFKDGLNLSDHFDQMLSYLRYANWTYGELIVRYPGPEGTKTFLIPKRDISFSFEDIEPQEIFVRPELYRAPIRPPNNPVTGDEIRTWLPGWTVNEITPLEDIGETAPTNNYSYAQAGRLYESFRKKKKTRPVVDKSPKDNHGFESSIEMEDIAPSVSQGAMAGPSTPNGAYSYLPQNSSVHGASANYIHPKSQSDNRYDDRNFDSNRHENRHARERQPQRPSRQHERQPVKSELYPEVHIVDKSSKSKSRDLYNKPEVDLSQGRESNQSSFSTAASSGPTDSGYHGNETDSYHSDRYPHDNGYSHGENLGFHHEEESEDKIMMKHKQFVNNMLQERQAVNNNLPVRKPRNAEYRAHQKNPGQRYENNYNKQQQNGPRSPRHNDYYQNTPKNGHYDSPRDLKQPDRNDRSPHDRYGNTPNNRHYENYDHYGNNPRQTYNEEHNTQHFNFKTENMSESFI
ncbi:hypothetical protein LOTGIDRAFT_174585 [Lottia gigantea]|uniref:Uncharacterized protein n=1 Tax=Lottia gigantea TaxID=225164 RepID=V4ATR7_LOTGI|nr:hypothetical protein LOTGIDRAFT_174585 [Lottia gigantea]ESO97151.1 hypothetical protein LOTGIDRAFT_174585 [Lottia gigantea]